MGEDLAAANVNRLYSLAASSIAIFTFMLFFLYPRFASGEINGWLYQSALVVMGVATFSFVFASLYYYCSSLGARFADVERATYSRRGDRFWLVGYTLLFLAPSLILFSIGLDASGLSGWHSSWCSCSSRSATFRGCRLRGRVSSHLRPIRTRGEDRRGSQSDSRTSVI